VLCLLRTLREEGITSIRTIDLTKSSEDVKATMGILKSQINITSTLIDLPEVVNATRQQVEAKQKAMARMAGAAVASGIHEVGGEQ
jgi:hypothetical protein